MFVGLPLQIQKNTTVCHVMGYYFGKLIAQIEAFRGFMTTKCTLKIYTTGVTPTSQRAIKNLQEICAEVFMDRKYEIVVINVIENPQLAEDEKILATPTEIKEIPPPMRRIIGDLSDKERVIIGLNLIPE